ncbi:MAG: multidrug DMT transporter permease [Acetobacteraceae bacterium]|nr:multidrug DMT transporter permease [Acetobacteraceae bacterium]
MYQPEAYTAALVLMLGSMICWGSWANMLKLTPGWPFQLFYWDYVLGVILGALLWGLTLGSLGTGGPSLLSELAQTDTAHVLFALAGGAIFNIANLLLVAAIEIAGLAIAFPVGIGLALIVGVVLNYALRPQGNPLLLAAGVALVSLAIVLDARAYYLRESSREASRRGVVISIACGVLMGSFYPLVTRATTGAAGLGPYGVAVIFAIGVALSALVANSLLMRRPLTHGAPVHMRDFVGAPPAWHVWGVLGGIIWCTGMVWNLVASHAQLVGPAVSYAIGQGATMVSALWGVVIWREFATAPSASKRMLMPMFVCFAAGLAVIAIVPLLS